MLKFALNRRSDQFFIEFDVPIDENIANHEALSEVLEFFSDKKDCSLQYDELKQITGLHGNISSFMYFIDLFLNSKEAVVQKKILNDIFHKDVVQQEAVKVNFHQNPFDNSFRYWSFILNQGYFTDYFFNRINWYIGPKNGYVIPFPLHVDIESASTCNMNCPMCYRDQLNDTGQMEFDLFQKAVDQCYENNVFSIRLSWRGETLTHPRIKEMIAYATKRIKNVSFLTNAFYIDEDMADCFIENKVNYVAVSFDGIGETYEAVRHPARFEDSYRRLQILKNNKQKADSSFPQVRLCTIWPAIKNDPDAYYKKMKDVSDYIVCNPYINFKGDMNIKPDFICQYPWERIVIAYNGATQCCTGWNANDIILGNIKDLSISQMWHSEMMNDIRKKHALGQRMKLNSCANCRHGSETDPDINISDILERRF